MDDRTIAAVIPLHNKENFVARAVASVLAQSRPVDEILVVDDASTDGSLDRLAAFSDPRLRILRRDQPGPGGYAARNLAIGSATARWIAFLDADDSWKDGFVAEIADLIARAPESVGCVFTGFEKIWSGGRVVQDRHSARSAGRGVEFLDFESFVSRWIDIGMSPIWTSACAIRRDVLLDVGLFPERMCRLGGDKDTWLRVMARTDALSSPRPAAVYHTVTENQVTRRESFNHRPCLVGSIERMLPGVAGRRRVLLERLFNLETFEQALKVDPREGVSADVYRGFRVARDPLRYGVLLGLTWLPARFRAALKGVVLRGRSVGRRLRGEHGLARRSSVGA